MDQNNSLESLSLADLQKPLVRQIRPDLAQFADSVLIKTYEEFVECLYRDIDECIMKMEEDPSIRRDDKETRLSEDFKMFLHPKGYQVTLEEQIGGHCDIVIRPRHKPFIWLGEAKIHDGYDYLKKGFDQLCTRYSQGTPGANQGGLLIYIRYKKAANILDKWKTKLSEYNLENYSVQECNNRPQLAFFSTHCHERSGLLFTVRHMAIVLYFEPKA